MSHFKEIMGLESFSQGNRLSDDPHVVPNLYLFQNWFEEYRRIYTHLNKSIQLLPCLKKDRKITFKVSKKGFILVCHMDMLNLVYERF